MVASEKPWAGTRWDEAREETSRVEPATVAADQPSPSRISPAVTAGRCWGSSPVKAIAAVNDASLLDATGRIRARLAAPERGLTVWPAGVINFPVTL